MFTAAVNKLPTGQIESPFDADALRILRDFPGLKVTGREPKQAGNHRANAILRFSGTRATLAVEVKRRVNAVTAWQFVHKATERPDVHLLVVAGETTAEARQILQNNGLAFVDDLRNAHIAPARPLFSHRK